MKTGNVAETCRIFDISRTTYYKWYKRYKESGIEGLKDKKRSSPEMPNKTPLEVEKLILDLVIENPEYGPRRLSQCLNEIGIFISESGVYNVLKRNNLNTQQNRNVYAKKYGYIPRSKSKKKGITLKSIENSYPGYAFQQGTSYIGKFPNLGRVYMMIIVDCYSYFTMAKIYDSKKYDNVEDIMKTKLIPITKAFNIVVENIITDGSREYHSNWKNGKHKYYELLSKHQIIHHVIPATGNTEINILKDINCIIYEEFYKNTFEIDYSDFDELQGDLQQYITYFNLERKIDSGQFQGRTPIEVFINKIDGEYHIPIWFLINSRNF